MLRRGVIKREPEDEEVNYLDIARSLITPAAGSFWELEQSSRTGQGLQSPSQSLDSQHPALTNSSLFIHNERRQAASPGVVQSERAQQRDSPATQSQNDRAAKLRAQLIEARKHGTPDPKILKESSSRMNLTQTASDTSTTVRREPNPGNRMNADIDALISSESKTRRNGNAENSIRRLTPEVGHPYGDTSNRDGSESNPKEHLGHRDRNVPGQRPSSSRNPESPHQRRASLQVHDSVQGNISYNKQEQADRDRILREKAAAEYKEKYGLSSGPVRTLSGNESSNENPDKIAQKSSKAPSLETFDLSTLPPDLKDWLLFTNWHNKEYRDKQLENYKKKQLLEQQLQELDRNDLELRSSLTMGRPAVTAALTPAPTSKPPENTEKPAPKTTVQNRDTVVAVKRPREEKEQEREPRKTPRSESRRPMGPERRSPKPLRPESRSNHDAPPPRDRGYRYTPPPTSRETVYPSGYTSYKPAPNAERDRERYEPYQSRPYEGRSYRPGYDERDTSRERERARERDDVRPPMLKYEDDELSRKRRPYQGFPIVPCRYFQEGNCYKGDRCTFLHD